MADKTCVRGCVRESVHECVKKWGGGERNRQTKSVCQCTSVASHPSCPSLVASPPSIQCENIYFYTLTWFPLWLQFSLRLKKGSACCLSPLHPQPAHTVTPQVSPSSHIQVNENSLRWAAFAPRSKQPVLQSAENVAASPIPGTPADCLPFAK